MSPFFIYLIFVLLTTLFSSLKPNGARIFIGLFFLAMAIGVNMITVLVNPQAYLQMGNNALLPFYRWIFQHVIILNPALFVLPIALFQTGIGTMMLHKGKYVKYGLIGGAVFLILIAPLGLESLPNLILAATLWRLSLKEYARSFSEMIAGKKPC